MSKLLELGINIFCIYAGFFKTFKWNTEILRYLENINSDVEHLHYYHDDYYYYCYFTDAAVSSLTRS